MKTEYNGIKFDSDLEVDYYKYLEELYDKKIVYEFTYHPKIPIQITDKNTYTPDFIVGYEDRIEIIETKGYNPYSKMRDDMIHNVMLNKSEEELRQWLIQNNILWRGKIIYKKIKYLKQFGWVDFDFKNPNTLANKRKAKINDLEIELKELKQFKKDTIRYFNLKSQTKKFTKAQAEFFFDYEKKMYRLLKGDNQNGAK